MSSQVCIILDKLENIEYLELSMLVYKDDNFGQIDYLFKKYDSFLKLPIKWVLHFNFV